MKRFTYSDIYGAVIERVRCYSSKCYCSLYIYHVFDYYVGSNFYESAKLYLEVFLKVQDIHIYGSGRHHTILMI